MSKELSGIEMTAIKVVEKSLNLAFPDDVNVELVFVNNLQTRTNSGADILPEDIRAGASFEAVYRQVNPYRQGKLWVVVDMCVIGIPRTGEDGKSSGHYLVWIPHEVLLTCRRELVPKCSEFVASWPVGARHQSYDVKVQAAPVMETQRDMYLGVVGEFRKQ